MQKLTLSIFFGTLMGLTNTGLAGRFYFEYGTDKVFLQNSAAGPRFDGGRFRVFLADGVYVYNDACALNGSLTSFGAAPLIGCATGSTAVITSGDLDEDGEQDAFTYWEVITPVKAEAIEPFREDLCKLLAAPASTLPRPLFDFSDISLDIFWHTQTPLLGQHTIAKYRLDRDYGYDYDANDLLDPDLTPGDGVASDALGAKMLKDIVPGQYVFQFPTLGAPHIPRSLSVGLLPFVEGYNSSNSAGKQGFKLVGNRWHGGYYQLDPRLVNTFNWARNQAVLSASLDRLFFSIETDDSLDYFPPNGARLHIPNTFATSYVLPGGFFDIGQTGVGSIDYDRNFVPTGISGNSGVYDGSTRKFKFPLKFVDTYTGYSRVSGDFPSEVVSAEPTKIAAAYDYDGDGFTNVTEFAMQSDPADATSTPFDPVYPPVLDGPVSTTNYEREDDGNLITITIQKRPDVGASLKYGLETKAPATTKWKKATVGAAASAKWTLVSESDTQIVFRSKSVVGVPLDTHIRPVATAVF